MYVGKNLDFAFSELHCGTSRLYHNALLWGSNQIWPIREYYDRTNCQASKATDPNLCMRVKILIFPLTYHGTAWPLNR